MFKAIAFTVNKFEHVYSKLRLYTKANNKQLKCLHRCTVKIQKLVTNVAVLRDSDGTALVPSEGTLGCLVPRPRTCGEVLDKVMGQSSLLYHSAVLSSGT